MSKENKGHVITIINITNLIFFVHSLQAYDRRKSVLTENERQYYNQLSKEYMSDESDSSDTQSIVVHKHPWRSESK